MINAKDLQGNKIFPDAIYGDIVIPSRFESLIKTKAFQRLKRIRQLATADSVFSGAVHTRFAHSIGVFHVMSIFVDRLEKLFLEIGVNVASGDVDAVLCAALLHDIGHGPYSHAFESISGIDHEKWTVDLISYDKEIGSCFRKNFDKNCKKNVIRILRGEENDSFLSAAASLLSGQFDADRLDYLIRDSYHTGVDFGKLNVAQFAESLQLTELDGRVRVCFDEKILPQMDLFFFVRYTMYDQVYYLPEKVMLEELLNKIVVRLKKIGLFSNDLLSKLLNKKLSIEEYLELDDYSFLELMKSIIGRTSDDILKNMYASFESASGYYQLHIMNGLIAENNSFKRDLSTALPKEIAAYNGIFFKNISFSAYKRDPVNGQVYITKRNGILTMYDNVSRVYRYRGLTDDKFDIWLNGKAFVFVNPEILRNELSDAEWDDVERIIIEYDLKRHAVIEKRYRCGNTEFYDVVRRLKDFVDNECPECDYTFSIEKGRIIKDIYLDTADYDLKRKYASARIREENGKYTLSIKKDDGERQRTNSGRYTTFEKELSISESSIDNSNVKAFINDTMRQLFGADFGGGTELDILKPVVEIKNRRSVFAVTVNYNDNLLFQINCDELVYSDMQKIDNDDIHDFQIEIKLPSTDVIGRAGIKVFSERLLSLLGENFLYREKLSKYVRGLYLLGKI